MNLITHTNLRPTIDRIERINKALERAELLISKIKYRMYLCEIEAETTEDYYKELEKLEKVGCKRFELNRTRSFLVKEVNHWLNDLSVSPLNKLKRQMLCTSACRRRHSKNWPEISK